MPCILSIHVSACTTSSKVPILRASAESLMVHQMHNAGQGIFCPEAVATDPQQQFASQSQPLQTSRAHSQVIARPAPHCEVAMPRDTTNTAEAHAQAVKRHRFHLL